nr:hypothetical protein [uncultured Caproiciproducens sp.]
MDTANASLERKIEAQLAENEHQLKQIAGFKSTLYENMINGIISSEDYKTFRTKYADDAGRLQQAIGRSIFETARWMEWVRKNGVKLYTAATPFEEIHFDKLGYFGGRDSKNPSR